MNRKRLLLSAILVAVMTGAAWYGQGVVRSAGQSVVAFLSARVREARDIVEFGRYVTCVNENPAATVIHVRRQENGEGITVFWSFSPASRANPFARDAKEQMARAYAEIGTVYQSLLGCALDNLTGWNRVALIALKLQMIQTLDDGGGKHVFGTWSLLVDFNRDTAWWVMQRPAAEAVDYLNSVIAKHGISSERVTIRSFVFGPSILAVLPKPNGDLKLAIERWQREP